MKMRINKYFLIGIVILAGCHSKTKTSPSHKGEVFVTIHTTPVPGGWGYKIYADTTLYIDQPFIPAIPGKVPFSSKELAQKTAELVVKKLKTDERPALDSADLKKLGVIK